MATRENVYIEKTPGVVGGRPRIAGRRIAVDHIAYGITRNGTSVERLCEAYDLTPAQVHAAMVYYYEHQEEIEQIMDEDEAWEPPAQYVATKEEFLRRWQERTGYDPEQELTVAEIASDYGISEQAVRKAAKEEWIGARKSGSTWLIKRLFAHQRWGEKD